MTTKILLRRRAPKHGENLLGYFLALTELNDYATTGWIRQIIDWSKKFVFSNGVRAEQLSALTGVDRSRLLPLYYLPAPASEGGRGGLKSYFCGRRLSSHMILPWKPKVCGACLKEDDYLRGVWDLAAVTCCPIHDTLLLQNCPACNKAVSWNRRRVSVCKCGFDWRECEGEQLEEKDVRISKHIYSLCGFLPGGSTRIWPSPIYSEMLDGFLTALILVASQREAPSVLNIRSREDADITGKSIVNLGNPAIHLLLNSALSVFEDWPNRYFDFVQTKLDTGKKSDHRRGLGHDFGEFYVTLFRRVPQDILVFMRGAFTLHTGSRRRIRVSPPPRLTAHDLLALGYFEKRAVRERLNIDIRFLETLMREGRLKYIVHRVGQQRYHVIEATSVEKFEREGGQFHRKSEVISILGVGEKALMSLVEHELLVPARSAVGDNNSWLFTPKSVLNLLKNLSARVKERSRDSFGFDAAYKPASREGCKFGQFIKAVLTGEIIPSGMNQRLGIKGLLFSAEQVKSFADRTSRIRKGDLIYLTDAAKLLGLTPKVAFYLRATGILPAREANSSSRAGFLVSKENVEYFKATYVKGSEIARRFQIHPGALPSLLMSAGIQPVCGPKIDGGSGSSYFFRVSDIETTNTAGLLTGAEAKRKRKAELLKEAKAKRQQKRIIAKKTVDTDRVPYDRADAARRAWVTIRANRAAANKSARAEMNAVRRAATLALRTSVKESIAGGYGKKP